MTVIKLDGINVLAELERIGWHYDPAGESEIRVLCPAHEDSNPSVGLNTENKLWKCHSCGAKGDFITFLAHALKVERGTIVVDLAKRYDCLEDVKAINPSTVEKFHTEIWKAGPLLKELRDRGITDDMIRYARLGFHNGRITIPVYDAQGRIVNIRRYLPGAPTREKMQNTKGYGAARLYQIDQLKKYDQVWLCGGEMKALAVGGLLRDKGIGAFCVAAGEGAWNVLWNDLLKGKNVYICMDVDNAGRAAARNIAQQIYDSCENVKIIRLPLDTAKYPKGDVNDYIGREKASPDDLIKLMNEARDYEPPVLRPGDIKLETKHVGLEKATHASNIGRLIIFEGVVSAMDTTPFLVPRKVGVSCDRKQPNCHQCPVKLLEIDEDTGLADMEIAGTSAGILDIVNQTKKALHDGIRDSLGIPTCKSVEFITRTHYNVVDLRLVPQLSIGNDGSKNVVQAALCVGQEVELNTCYEFTGVVYPNPKTQQAVILINQAVEVDDNLTSFDPSDEQLEELKLFQAADGEVERRLTDIYDDLAANVTRIFERQSLHLVYDLAFHSPLVFNFDGKMVSGWVNALITGDSSQGKSEASTRLMEHYGLGERVECKNATVAGLLGGLQMMGNRWFVSWGVIPTHDRRIVFLEEIKGASTEVLGKLTDMRSSGIAEIPKIERRRAHARTRLVMISNPRSSRTMSSFNFGIEAIHELIGSLEDIRRFDISLIVSSDQVDPGMINLRSNERRQSAHKYTSDLSRRLILWAWTRRVDQVIFTDDAVNAILQSSIRLCGKFTETLPLIDRGTIRHKLARLSAALAARVFSCSDDMMKIVVKKEHVDVIVNFIDVTYSDRSFGYKDFTDAQTASTRLMDPETVSRRLRGTKYPADLVRQLLHRDDISRDDLCDWCDVSRDDAQTIISFLVRKHALYRDRLSYKKTGEFIVLLKEMDRRGVQQEDFPKEAM